MFDHTKYQKKEGCHVDILLPEEPQITKDFTWREMLVSETAHKKSICNKPGVKEINAIKELVAHLLQPLREAYGKPIRISSGFRCKELNTLIGGIPNSQHVKGEAADCIIEDPEKFLEILQEKHFPFDQAIWYKTRSFIHLSLRKQHNRYSLIIKE